MARMSKEERRGVACMTFSYAVHFVLIIACSFVYMGLRETGAITLTVDNTDHSHEPMFFETVLDELDVELEGIEEAQLEHQAEAFEMDEAEDDLLSQTEREMDLSNLDSIVSSRDSEGTSQRGDGGGKAKKASAKKKRPKVNGVGFFGLEPTGQKVTFIIDMSVSMERGYNDRRYDRAVAETLYAIEQMHEDQVFFVYLFCFRMYPMRIGPSGRFLSPTEENVDKLADWLDSVRLGSGTDPRESLVHALRQKPNCIFLLSDGEFNGRQYNNRPYLDIRTAVELADSFNLNECPINTIGLEDRGNQLALTRIANASGGVYKFIPAENEVNSEGDE